MSPLSIIQAAIVLLDSRACLRGNPPLGHSGITFSLHSHVSACARIRLMAVFIRACLRSLGSLGLFSSSPFASCLINIMAVRARVKRATGETISGSAMTSSETMQCRIQAVCAARLLAIAAGTTCVTLGCQTLTKQSSAEPAPLIQQVLVKGPLCSHNVCPTDLANFHLVRIAAEGP
jgi:hypothetical protein